MERLMLNVLALRTAAKASTTMVRILFSFVLIVTLFYLSCAQAWSDPLKVMACQYGKEDCNPHLEDPVGTLGRLVYYGELLGFRHIAGYPSLRGAGPEDYSHWQGAVRMMKIANTGLNGRYLVIDSSHTGKRGWFAVARISGPSAGLNWGSNKFMCGKNSWKQAPPESDTITSMVQMTQTTHWHPGGMQAIGRYLLIPVEKNQSKPNNAAVYMYDMQNPMVPKLIWIYKLQGSEAATVGIAKLTDGTYLMVIGRKDTRTLDFYKSKSADIRHDNNWDHIGFFDTKNIWWGGNQWSTYQKRYPMFSPWSTYQTLNLIADRNGNLFLIGTYKLDSGLPSYSGEDMVDLFRLTIVSGGAISIEKVASRALYCSTPQSGSGLHCNFDAAVAAYIDENNSLIIYATEHGNNGEGDSTRMKEFRTLPKINVVSCEKETKAWIELYEHVDFKGRSVLINFDRRNSNCLKQFSLMDDFNDKVSSVRWCLPQGHGFMVFEHKDFGGGKYIFQGNGIMQSIPNLNYFKYTNTGKSLHDSISSGKWF